MAFHGITMTISLKYWSSNILISQHAVAFDTSTGHMCLNQACMRDRLSHIQDTCRLRTAAKPVPPISLPRILAERTHKQ